MKHFANQLPSLRRLVAIAGCLIILMLAATPGRAASAFVDGFDDLPLMPGLSVLGGEAMTFDSPGGRIVENTATGAVSQHAVLDFYGSTLPQLGWSQMAPRQFVREGETLMLEFLVPGTASGSGLTVHFRLSPVEK